MTKTQQIEIAIAQVQIALDYLREARRESRKVLSDDRVTKYQADIGLSHLHEAERQLEGVCSTS